MYADGVGVLYWNQQAILLPLLKWVAVWFFSSYRRETSRIIPLFGLQGLTEFTCGNCRATMFAVGDAVLFVGV